MAHTHLQLIMSAAEHMWVGCRGYIPFQLHWHPLLPTHIPTCTLILILNSISNLTLMVLYHVYSNCYVYSIFTVLLQMYNNRLGTHCILHCRVVVL